MNPYLATSLMFLLVAILAAIDASLTHMELLPWFNGLRWLRVHFVTLGVVTEALFGFMPLLAARRAGLPRPAPRLDIWLAVTAGIVVLAAGIPLVNPALIFAGGTLVFVATTLLVRQLRELRPAPLSPAPERDGGPRGHYFYVAGLGFFLLGIVIGTGLWLGWNDVLRMARPIEVHIHANGWGFLSLVFAGLLIDQYPHFAGRELAWPGSIRRIFWLMTLGALGLVFGPWLGLMALMALGMIMHLVATIWLLLNVGLPLGRDRASWTPGMVHIFAAYVWIVVPLLFAPFILFGVEGFPAADVEANAPQALIYGWALQFAYALVPYLYARYFAGAQSAALGGTRFSVVAVNVGSLLLFLGIFLEPQRAALHAAAYLAWAGSMIPILADLWRTSQRILASREAGPDPGEGADTSPPAAGRY